MEELEVEPSHDDILGALDKTDNLPRLRVLRLIGAGVTPGALAWLTGLLPRLERLEVAPENLPFSEVVHRFTRARPPLPLRMVQLDRDARVAEGWSILFEDGATQRATVERTGLTDETTLDQLEAALAALPADTAITVRPGPLWDPMPR